MNKNFAKKIMQTFLAKLMRKFCEKINRKFREKMKILAKIRQKRLNFENTRLISREGFIRPIKRFFLVIVISHFIFAKIVS